MQFIQLKLDPASGNTVPANGNGSVTQGLSVTNNQQGQVYEDLHPLVPPFYLASIVYLFYWLEFNFLPYDVVYNC